MDGGLFNTPRSTDRRPTARPEPTTRAGAEPSPPPTEHRTTATSTHRGAPQPKKTSKSLPLIIGSIVAALLIGAGIWWLVSRSSGAAAGVIDTSKYQAVLLTSGESYFGKLAFVGDEYMKLTEVYYVQKSTTEEASTDETESTAESQNSLQLIKLGNEVYGPEDELMIARDQVLYFVNMKSDSKVTQTIEQDKKK